MRKTVFSSGEIYHVYNIGVEKRPIFMDKREYERALLTIDFYRYFGNSLCLSNALKLNSQERDLFFSQLREKERIVEIYGYCLMPNHFHLLIKQLMEGGVANFISNFSNSYTKYFNLKNGRVGHLLKGVFNAVRIEDDKQLIHVLRYIHINPVVSYVIKEKFLDNYPYSSFSEYLSNKQGICNKELIMNHFLTIDKLKEFTYDQVDYGKRLEFIKHLIIE